MKCCRVGRPGVARLLATLAIVWLTLSSTSSVADVFDEYNLVGTFSLPTGTGPFTVLPDGRMVAVVGDQLFTEDTLGKRVFALYGTLPNADIAPFGAAFVALSPNGMSLAVGNNGGASFRDFQVGVLDFATLSGTWFSANHFIATWLDDTHLAIAASDFSNGSSVTLLDTTSPDPFNPINPVLVDHIGGASGGIAFDGNGVLFTANGFTSIGPSETGTIKAFDMSSWSAAISSGTPLDFENEGIFVTELLGGTPLAFDAEGNLFAGGGSSPPESDAVAVVRAVAIAQTLAGGGSVDPNDGANVRRFDPIVEDDFNFYGFVYNRITSELYVRDFGDDTVYVYHSRISFAVSVISYSPAPGQDVNISDFNDPSLALGPPRGLDLDAADNTSIVTLGAFGGSIILGFDHTVMDDILNPYGMDAIVFGNAFWIGRDPNRHWAEPAMIEISLDQNKNGLADDPWFLIPGSHITDPQSQFRSMTWDDDIADTTFPPALASWLPAGRVGQWMTSGYQLPADPFNETAVINPSGEAMVEGIWGYADYTPTLPLGDLDADGFVDDVDTLAEDFYTVPDDPHTVGISPGSGGGDAFDIAWAIDPSNGHPAELTGFDFIRITTAVNILDTFFGEKSTEVDAVADVRADPHGDSDQDGDIDLRDVGMLHLCFGWTDGRDPRCALLDREQDGLVDLEDAMRVLQRITGPR